MSDPFPAGHPHANCSRQVGVHAHAGPRRVASRFWPITGGEGEGPSGGSWRLRVDRSEAGSGTEVITLRAQVLTGSAPGVSVSLDWHFPDWSPEVYVLLPGAVYAGNRFPVLDTLYPPLPPARRPEDPDQRPRITRVPRLSAEPGWSRLAVPSADPAVPAIGLWFPSEGIGRWLLTPAVNARGVLGYTLEENADRTAATLRIGSPCVREFAYEMCQDRGPSPDRAADLGAGDEIVLEVREHVFPCTSVQALFDALVPLRRAAVPAPRVRADIPLSAVWAIQEDKFNRENWVEPAGYYAVGVEPLRSRSIHQDWQAGWVGGMLHTHALYLRGHETSRERVRRNFDFLVREGQAPAGFYYGVVHQGRPHGDRFDDFDAPWHLLRKSADVLFYGLATLRVMEARGETPRAAWAASLRRCADAFVRLWDRHGQFGQFADHHTGELLVSGSVAAGIAPAGLWLAADRWPAAAEYRRVALAAAAHYDEHYLQHGLTNGGPGEIAQGADSESAAGLLESLVTLAEATRAPRWIEAARRCAVQLSTWVFSYDFPFPPDTEFGRLGMLSAGTVIANVQNKHSAPGLCSHSGLSLLRLHRLTGEPFFLELARDIARALPQYMSRVDRPITFNVHSVEAESPEIRHLKPGWMCERVNVTCWGPGEPVGEVFYYSCWSEVALALTGAELPSVYAQPDTGRIAGIDGIEATWADAARRGLCLRNPTAFPAEVRLLVETAATAARVNLGPDYAATLPRVALAAGEELTWRWE